VSASIGLRPNSSSVVAELYYTMRLLARSLPKRNEPPGLTRRKTNKPLELTRRVFKQYWQFCQFSNRLLLEPSPGSGGLFMRLKRPGLIESRGASFEQPSPEVCSQTTLPSDMHCGNGSKVLGPDCRPYWHCRPTVIHRALNVDDFIGSRSCIFRSCLPETCDEAPAFLYRW
jgi:hypothetical protein